MRTALIIRNGEIQNGSNLCQYKYCKMYNAIAKYSSMSGNFVLINGNDGNVYKSKVPQAPLALMFLGTDSTGNPSLYYINGNTKKKMFLQNDHIYYKDYYGLPEFPPHPENGFIGMGEYSGEKYILTGNRRSDCCYDIHVHRRIASGWSKEYIIKLALGNLDSLKFRVYGNLLEIVTECQILDSCRFEYLRIVNGKCLIDTSYKLSGISRYAALASDEKMCIVADGAAHKKEKLGISFLSDPALKNIEYIYRVDNKNIILRNCNGSYRFTEYCEKTNSIELKLKNITNLFKHLRKNFGGLNQLNPTRTYKAIIPKNHMKFFIDNFGLPKDYKKRNLEIQTKIGYNIEILFIFNKDCKQKYALSKEMWDRAFKNNKLKLDNTVLNSLKRTRIANTRG